LKRDELKDLIKPHADSTASVLNWLQQSGIESRDIQMMGTSFKTYQSQHRPEVKKIRSLSYSVPKEVRDHVDMIQPVSIRDPSSSSVSIQP
jgi:tripeptidyl-peptidase-1